MQFWLQKITLAAKIYIFCSVLAAKNSISSQNKDFLCDSGCKILFY
jgi:hypothetical protein